MSRGRAPTERIPAWEGPFEDFDGNPCLGIWADEGGVLLVLQQRPYGGVAFHALNTAGLPHLGPATLASFRLPRVEAFLLDAQKKPSDA